MQTTENTHPQSFKAHLSSNSSHKEQAEPLALLQNWVQGKGEGSCKKKQKKLEVAFKRWKEVAGFFPPIKLTEPPQAEPSALQEAEKLERYFFSLTNSRDTIQSSSTCKKPYENYPMSQ